MYRPPCRWEVAGLYWHLSQSECRFHPQIHSWSCPSKLSDIAPSCSFSFPFIGGLGAGSILLISGYGGGIGIILSANSTDDQIVRSRLA
jgi:hypothetical protein